MKPANQSRRQTTSIERSQFLSNHSFPNTLWLWSFSKKLFFFSESLGHSSPPLPRFRGGLGRWQREDHLGTTISRRLGLAKSKRQTRWLVRFENKGNSGAWKKKMLFLFFLFEKKWGIGLNLPAGLPVRLIARLFFMEAMWKEDYPPNTVLHTRAEVISLGATMMFRSACKSIPLHLTGLDDDPVMAVGDQIVIFNFQAQPHADGFVPQRLPNTKLGKIDPQVNLQQFLEPCAGMGALSLGAEEMGFTPGAALDISPLAVKAYEMNHDAPCLHGNLLDGQDLWRLFEVIGGKRMGLATGFPCPPFSTMGDQQGFKDSRSSVFTQCLNLGYLFDSCFLVLECTPKTGTWAEVQDCLASFSSAMNMRYHTKVINLQNTWPCRRTRWWASIFPVELLHHFPPLCDLPCVPELQVLGSAVPEWPIWPESDQAALAWMQFEAESLLSVCTTRRCPPVDDWTVPYSSTFSWASFYAMPLRMQRSSSCLL